ncbi:MAG: hypothetical protein L6263_09210, partial [Desulfobacteraceae bacterium]|nr:hypothetical protein [Desulfobacteraceae bacterium]
RLYEGFELAWFVPPDKINFSVTVVTHHVKSYLTEHHFGRLGAPVKCTFCLTAIIFKGSV